MRLTSVLGAVGLLATACPLAAAQGAPNTLTQKEAAAGWIQLFDGKTDWGWKSRGTSTWSVSDGALQAGGGAGVLANTTEFADFELKADVWLDSQANSGIFLRAPVEGDVTAESGYEVNVYDAHKQWPTGSINNVGKSRRKVTSVGRWTHFDVLAEGDHLAVSVDGKKTLDLRDRKHARGVVALQYNGQGVVRFRDVKLRPLGLKSIFNGKDLSGWKEVPGHKSVYSVTPEGWLNVKNGNGDIQTEAAYGDFVLQLDVISNGDHLNSGVFFRANPGLFWSGYEAQIRNQWEGDNRDKAVDYGTGGVYNRQPARRVVSSDREWFTYTIVAHGLHISTWVNGYQVADFQDNRPANEGNARAGARAKAGVLSLQGHDPTTDLSFRNIKVMELPGKP